MIKRILLTLILLLTSVTLMASSWSTLTPAASFAARYKAASVVDGTTMYLLSGVKTSTYYNDVWSSTNGVDWTLRTGNAEFQPRYGAMALNYDSKLWIIGGYAAEEFPNDAWYSVDGGVEWTAATRNAAFTMPVGGADACVYDDKMWFVDGVNKKVYYSTDGADWTAATLNAEFPDSTNPRQLVSFGGKLWLLGRHTEVWNSTNGAAWIQVATGKTELLAADIIIPKATKLYAVDTNNQAVYSSTDGITWVPEVLTVNMSSRTNSVGWLISNRIVVGSGAYFGIYKNDVYMLSEIATPTPTRTNTPKPSKTFTPAPTSTITPTKTNTAVNTATNTKTVTSTMTLVDTATDTETITPTFTITMTWTAEVATDTYTVTDTPTTYLSATNTPIWTATTIPTTYVNFLHYADCITCGNCSFVLEWNTIVNPVWPVLYRVYYSGDYSYYEDVRADQNETTAPGRMVYTLKNMKWDKTYSITVATFYEDQPFSSTSNAIAISCFETPTPTWFETSTPTYTPTAVWTQQDSITVANLTPQHTAVPYLTQIPIPTGVAVISEPTPAWTQQNSMAITFPTPEWTQVAPLATIWVYMINWPTPILTPTSAATATPAVTMSRSVSGLIKFDNFEDGVVGANYNNIVFTTKSGTWKYTNRPGSATQGPIGNNSVTVTNGYLRVTNVANNSQFRISAWVYLSYNSDVWFTFPNGEGLRWDSWDSKLSMANQGLFIGGSTSSANPEYLNTWWFLDAYVVDASAAGNGYGSINGIYYPYAVSNVHTYSGTAPRASISSKWVYTDNNYGFLDIASSTGSPNYVYYDNLNISADRYVYFTGLQPGDMISIVDDFFRNTCRVNNAAGGSQALSAKVESILGYSTTKIDLIGFPPGTPVRIKLENGTGWVWYSDTITDLNGGDTWNFTGL